MVTIRGLESVEILCDEEYFEWRYINSRGESITASRNELVLSGAALCGKEIRYEDISRIKAIPGWVGNEKGGEIIVITEKCSTRFLIDTFKGKYPDLPVILRYLQRKTLSRSQ